MPYQYITNINAANFTPGAAVQSVFGHRRRVEFIGIHHWGNDGQRFEDVCNYLASANPRQSSAHEVIEAGRVACLVNHGDASWAMANPTGYPNACGVHLELRPEATDGDYATAAERIADIRETWGDIPLRPHNEFTATACPGRYDLGRLDAEARAVAAARSGTPAETAPAAPAPALSESGRRWIVDPGDTLGGIAAHYGFTVEELARVNNIANPDRINVGDVLVIPNGGSRRWIVDPGDTLSKIAAHFGSTVELIAAANGIADPDRIEVGMELQVP